MECSGARIALDGHPIDVDAEGVAKSEEDLQHNDAVFTVLSDRFGQNAPARSTRLPAQAIQRRALAQHWDENQLGPRPQARGNLAGTASSHILDKVDRFTHFALELLLLGRLVVRARCRIEANGPFRVDGENVLFKQPQP